MQALAFFRGKSGLKSQDKQPAAVHPDPEEDEVEKPTHMKRHTKNRISMRKKKHELPSPSAQSSESPASPRRQSQEVSPNSRTGPSPAQNSTAYPVYKRVSMSPHPIRSASPSQSRTALPSNGEPGSPHTPQNGGTSFSSAAELKGGSKGAGSFPNYRQHGLSPHSGHFPGTPDMDSLTHRVSSCTVRTPQEPSGRAATADLEEINLRLNNGGSSQKSEGREPVCHSINIVKKIEFLYQEYRDTSKQQEIQQRRQRDGAGGGGGGDGGGGAGGMAPATLQLQLRNSTQSLSLWQNLEVVRQSGLLSKLTQKEVIVQEAMFELVTSEASYYKSLELLETHFLKNPVLVNTLSQSDMHFIFSNIEGVMKASEKFLMDLENRMEQSIQISDVCDIVCYHAVHHFHVFTPYVINQAYQEKNYRRILQENTAFQETMAQLENQPRVRGLSFTSFLILPFQRITRLKLLVQNILKKVEENSEKETNAIKAHYELEKIVKECNEGVRKMSRTEELIIIEKTLEFKSKSVPVISHSRWLLKKGELQNMSGPKNTRTMRTRKLYQPVYLFLFNNLLLITKKSSSGEKFQVLDSCERAMLRTEDLEDQGQMLANVFCLHLLENQDDRPVSYMLKTSSMSDKLRWICALTPNRRTRFYSTSAQQPDSPQVQCVQSYSSQESDELSIEMADILNVLEKTDDGWMMGERLHDGEKGWFPCRVVEEIKNEELRAQNLRECQRIHQAQGGGPGPIVARSRGRRTAKLTNH
ncbi:hypothetical protein SKAU_G00079520 [Synaphobranchus kaupii]|uniref:Neuronal guanine nucleotide exchange factor n=1 Tax=Synaphobranchus kaupii TaxID=118154 RepID=A0A9Q1J523_SYNKA|nr:hypothetical protein SKAU_G00079520 [Synaphobranchus kaupii]